MGTIAWSEAREGMSFPAWERGGLDIALFQAYGEASGDGNPMHTDDDYARELGYPGVFAQGMLIMAFAAQHLTDLARVGRLRRIRSKFKKPTWPGETLRFTATVVKKYEQGGKKFLDLDVRGSSLEGEEKIVTEATVICS
jgi:acyl dehydratase